MSDILGYDCDGKPLRAGDRVVVVRVMNRAHQHAYGGEYSIIGPCPLLDDQIEFSERGVTKRYLSGFPSSFRKIDQPETGDWSEVERKVRELADQWDQENHAVAGPAAAMKLRAILDGDKND